jgi:glycerophosphoryl diester phosphodiesterase
VTDESRPAIFAHRGGHDGPPNSVEAIRRAIEAGADGVEIDIQLASGDVLVARHDPDPDLAEDTLAHLTDVLAVVEEAGIRLLIDFKSNGDPAHEAAVLASALAAAARSELIAVSSFSVPFLERFQELSSEFPLYPIISLRQNFPRSMDLERWSGASVLAAALVVNPFLLRGLRRNNGGLLVWFGATEWGFLIRALRRLDADAVIVGRVARTVTLLRGA